MWISQVGDQDVTILVVVFECSLAPTKKNVMKFHSHGRCLVWRVPKRWVGFKNESTPSSNTAPWGWVVRKQASNRAFLWPKLTGLVLIQGGVLAWPENSQLLAWPSRSLLFHFKWLISSILWQNIGWESVLCPLEEQLVNQCVQSSKISNGNSKFKETANLKPNWSLC